MIDCVKCHGELVQDKDSTFTNSDVMVKVYNCCTCKVQVRKTYDLEDNKLINVKIIL